MIRKIIELSEGFGFGIAFLKYIAPLGGRSYPRDSSPLDLWDWHTSIQVADAKEVYQKIQESNYPSFLVALFNLIKLLH